MLYAQKTVGRLQRFFQFETRYLQVKSSAIANPSRQLPGLCSVRNATRYVRAIKSAAEDAFCRTLTDQKQGVNGLLAVVSPNLMVKPATVMFNKVTIKNMKQAVQMFGPAQRGVSLAVAECVEEGTIPTCSDGRSGPARIPGADGGELDHVGLDQEGPRRKGASVSGLWRGCGPRCSKKSTKLATEIVDELL